MFSNGNEQQPQDQQEQYQEFNSPNIQMFQSMLINLNTPTPKSPKFIKNLSSIDNNAFGHMATEDNDPITKNAVTCKSDEK